VLAPERNLEHSIGDQVMTLNVEFMERLQSLQLRYLPANEGDAELAESA